MNTDSKFITVKEAAAFLEVTEIHLRNLLNEGKIPYVNVAAGSKRKSIKIERQVIEDFVKNGGVKS